MKKQSLRQIIKEEIQNVLKEALYEKITNFNDIDFSGRFRMEGWIIHCDGLKVQHEKFSYRVEWFDNIEELKHWVKKKFNYYINFQLKKGFKDPAVFIQSDVLF